MKRLFTLFLALSQTACAVYTGASIVSLTATGKSVGDHAASLTTGADCNAWRASTELTYYCEYLKDPATTYNRSPY
jgi:hypothetical protein